MFLVPFIRFPFHFPVALSLHVFLSSCLVVSSLFFFCARMAQHLVCTCTTYFQPRFHVAQVFTMRWALIGCPCALGSLSSQPHTHTHLCPVLSSFHVLIRLSCCAHTFAWAFSPPLGGACVCNPWSHRDPDGFVSFLWTFSAGGSREFTVLLPTKTAVDTP